MRFTTRRAMIAIAAIAVFLGIAVAINREIGRHFPRTPAEWAWNEVASHEKISISPKVSAREAKQRRTASARLAKQYRELALEFERTGEIWGEETYQGPFTDILNSGQAVILGQAIRVKSEDLEGPSAGSGEAWSLAKGTVGVVKKDWAFDEDSCYEDREISVRFVYGPLKDKIGSIKRIYLRRKP